MIVWFLTGMWHGAYWNYILWGLWNGMFLCLEKYVWGKLLEKWPKFFRRLYALLIITLGLTIFALEDGTMLVSYLMSMVGQTGAGLVSSHLWWSLMNYGFLLVLAIALAFGIAPFLKKKLQVAGKNLQVICSCIGAIATVILFLACSAYLIGDTYNPFLYFRF